MLKTSRQGLSSEEAAHRHVRERGPTERSGLVSAILKQIQSPLTAGLAAGAGLSEPARSLPSCSAAGWVA